MITQNQMTADMQSNFNFAVNTTTHIKKKVYEKKYADITYAQDIPVDTSPNEFANSVTYYSEDSTGQARWYNGVSDDIPYANSTQEQFEVPIHTAAIGFDWTYVELGQSRMLGRPLNARNAMSAKKAYEQMVDRVAYLGDAEKGFVGLYNSTAVPNMAAANGAGGSPLWASKTPDELLLDINNLIVGIYVDTNTIEMCGDIHLPIEHYAMLGSRRLGDTGQTVLDFLSKNNIYTQKTGQLLRFKGSRHLATAGVGGTSRIMAYRKDPEVLTLHIPMPLKFLAPQPENLRVKVPGIFRLAGLDFTLPNACRYLDAV